MGRYEPSYKEIEPYFKERRHAVKKEKCKRWPKGMKFTDDEAEAATVPFYTRLSAPDPNRSFSGNAIIRCIEGPGHSALNSW